MGEKNPPGPPTGTDELITRRLAALHKERELILAQPAERCAASKAVTSCIRRSQNNPTASVLGRLVDSLGVAPSELLDDARTPAEPLCRRAQQEVWEDPAGGYHRRQVGVRNPHSSCEVAEVEILANARFDYPRWGGRPYRQRLWLVEGALRMDYGEQTFHLQHDDRLDFGIDCAVIFAATGQACRCLLAILHDQSYGFFRRRPGDQSRTPIRCR